MGLLIVKIYFQIVYVLILIATLILISIQSYADQFIVNCRKKTEK